MGVLDGRHFVVVVTAGMMGAAPGLGGGKTGVAKRFVYMVGGGGAVRDGPACHIQGWCRRNSIWSLGACVISGWWPTLVSCLLELLWGS